MKSKFTLNRGSGDKKQKRTGSRKARKRDPSNINDKKKMKFPLNATDSNFYKATQLYTGGEGIKKKTRKRGFKYMSNKPSPLSGALNTSAMRKSTNSVK